MKPHRLDRLAALPALSPANRRHVPCRVCGAPAQFFDVVDFNKICSEQAPYEFGQAGIPVPYHCCDLCEHVFTVFFDDWSTQEFARFIYNADYIKVDGDYLAERPNRQAAELDIRLADAKQARILDYGSGTGLLAQLLRARGFTRVESYDPFSNPERPVGRFDIVTCYEVLEHATSPREILADIASLTDPAGCVLFTTGIQPPDIRSLRANWWYVAPRNGHASIYSRKSLALAGQSAGLTLHGGADGMAFAGADPSPATRNILAGIGTGLRVHQLWAPRRADPVPAYQQDCWYMAESAPAGGFRWTRQSRIAWRLQHEPLPAAEYSVTVPFCNEVQPGFAAGCSIEIGCHKVAVTCRPGALTASFLLDEPADATATLITGAPLRPCDLRDVPDSRPLGLAIRMPEAGAVTAPTPGKAKATNP